MDANLNNKELLDAALQYVEAGWKILPLSGKRPINGFRWAELRDREVMADEVRGWFSTYGDQITGIGLMTGYKAGVCILDLEKGEDPEKFKIPHTVAARSGGGGWHFYLSVPNDLPGGALPTTDLRPYGIEGELRADDTYTALPPSKHPSGNLYEWVVPLDRKDLAPVSKQLLELASKKVRQPQDWSAKMAGTTEGSRHTLTVSVAGKLLHHIPQHEWDSIIPPLLDSWNKVYNKPALESAEVKEIYKSLQHKHASQHPPQAPAQPERKLLTVSDILKLPDEQKPEFLVQALVPENGITALSGHPGCGKSWLMLHMAYCIATGGRFLGQLATKKGNVLIVDEESGVWEMKRRMQLLGYSDEVPVYFHCQNGFKIDKKEDLDRLLQTVVDNDIKLVVFDPFVAIHSKVENSAEEAQAVMEQLQRFNGVGASVLIVHHHRKGGVGGGGLSLRGSSAFSGRLDSHITVTKADKELDPINLDIEHEKSRRGRNLPEFRVMLTEHENSSVTLDYAVGVGVPVIKKDRAQELILEVLKDGECSFDDLADAIHFEEDIGTKNIRNALKALETEGKVVSRREGKKKMYSRSQETLPDVAADDSAGEK